MSEVWKSQPRKFCDFCKCWIADNKVSISFHETGKRHKEAVELKLRSIRKKSKEDEARAQQEDDWIRIIEEKAMKDYRAKDLDNNPDLTAKIFHERRNARDAERERRHDEDEEREQEARRAAAKKIVPVPSTSNGFMTVGAGDADKPAMLRKVAAPTSGTRWHNPPPKPKLWFEAMTGTGDRYFWNTQTQESRWDPPPEGFTSIHEQSLMAEKNIPMPSGGAAAADDDDGKEEEEEDEEQEQEDESEPEPEAPKKSEAYFPRPEKIRKREKSPETADPVFEQGPAPRANPYGEWSTVQPKVDPTSIDYQTPVTKEAAQCNVTLHSDRLTTFKEKSTPSLGDDTSTSASTGAAVVKPAIVFRKRKVVNQDFTRKRDEEN